MKPFERKPYGPKNEKSARGAGPHRRPAPARAPRHIAPATRQAPSRQDSRPAPKPPTISRRIALDALLDVASAGAYSTLALDKRLRDAKLSSEDRRLVTALFYGVIEKKTALEYILSKYMERPSEDSVTMENLKMGVYQLFYMDIPDYAACGEAVALSRAMGREALCPLVNAVLRKIANEKHNFAWPAKPMDRLSIETSTPPWLIRKLSEDIGAEETEAFLRYIPSSYYTSLCVNTMRTDEQSLMDILRTDGFPVEKGLVPGSLRVVGGGLADTDAFRRGLYLIQSEASTLAALSVGAKGGMQIFDACAAPGGKSFVLAQAMRGSGRVHAMDLHEHRTKLIEAGAQRLGLENIRPRVGDARNPLPSLERTMDAVLVDAPCSGLGIVGKADVRQRLTPADLHTLPELQKAILENCAKLVKPGGTLVYSTCTVFSAENRAVVDSFLQAHSEFSLRGLERNLPEAFAAKGKDGTLMLMPQRDGTDGFFIARMVRVK